MTLKQSWVRKLSVLVLAITLMVITLPIAFSKSNHTDVKYLNIPAPAVLGERENFNEASALLSLYDKMNLGNKGLSEEAYQNAIKGFLMLKEQGKLNNDDIISIADFTLSSAKKRFFIIDVQSEEILFNTYVAHGQKTGGEYAKMFSNTPESYQSSPGFYVTSGTYTGKNGFSMKLYGQESGINDRAYDRAIVMHGAPYVSEGFIKARGYIGRSWGCPAVPQELNKAIIETIKNGTCLFLYANDSKYLNNSKILNS